MNKYAKYKCTQSFYLQLKNSMRHIRHSYFDVFTIFICDKESAFVIHKTINNANYVIRKCLNNYSELVRLTKFQTRDSMLMKDSH